MLLAAACLEKADASPADDWCQILLCSAMMVMKDLAAIVSGPWEPFLICSEGSR